MAHEDSPPAVVVNAAITQTPGVFPRVPGDQPANYPEQSPPGFAWTIYNYRERRSYWHFGRPVEWAEDGPTVIDEALSPLTAKERAATVGLLARRNVVKLTRYSLTDRGQFSLVLLTPKHV